MGSKITIAPGNISFLYDAIKHMVDLGYDEINANCVYEKGWTPVHATVLYDQMKRISDYSWNRILILNVISSVPFIMKTSFSLKILMIYKVGVEALVIQ